MAAHEVDFYRSHPHLARLGLWMTLERPDTMRSMPLVLSANADQAAAVKQAQAAGTVRAAPRAERLLDHILILAHGHFMNAADAAASWTDRQRADLASSVATLIRPSAPSTIGIPLRETDSLSRRRGTRP